MNKLTEKEKDIVCIILNRQCFTRKEIAEELNISVHTVALHLSHIYIKLGISRSIAGIVYHFLRKGAKQ